MKIVFLSILAATAISSITASPKNLQTNNQKENTIIECERPSNRKTTKANANGSSLVWEVEENDSYDTATFFSNSTTQIGGYLSTFSDKDYFAFSIKEKRDYHFRFEAGQNGAHVTLYEYVGDLDEKYDAEIAGILHNEWDIELNPGTYYLKFWDDGHMYPSTGLEYALHVSYAPVERSFGGFTLDEQNRQRYKVVLWDGDVKVKNDKEPNCDVQTLKTETISYVFGNVTGRETKGWCDPIFSFDSSSNISEKYIDSILYIWDKQTLIALNDVLKEQIRQGREAVRNERIRSVKTEFTNTALEGEDALEKFIVRLAIGCDNGLPPKKVDVNLMDIVTSVPVIGDLIKIFELCDLADYVASVNTDDIDYFTMMGKIQEACANAIQTNRALKIPKYVYVSKEVTENRFLGCGTRTIKWNLYKNDCVFDLDYNFLVDYNSEIEVAQISGESNCVNKGDIYPFINFEEYEEYVETGEYNENQLHPVLESISLSGYHQWLFELGDEFNSEGLKVIAHYNGSNDLEVTTYFIDSYGVNTNEVGEYEAIIYYTEGNITKSVSYPVYVIWPQEIKYSTVQIEIDSDDLHFYTGHGVNRYEAYLSIRLEDAISQNYPSAQVIDYEINGDLLITGVDLSFSYGTDPHLNAFITSDNNSGSSTITVYYQYTGNKNNQVEKLILSGGCKKEFVEGEDFTWEGLVVTAIYTDLEGQQVTDYTVDYSNVNMLYQGEYPVYVTYTECGISQTAYYTVTVREPLAIDMSLRGTYQTVFEVGDEFNYDGLEAVIIRENGGTTPVNPHVYVDNIDMSTAGTYTVEVVYFTADLLFHKSYDIVVKDKEPILKSISLSGSYKKTFYVGEEFSYEGLIVTAHYDYKEDQQVTDFEVIAPSMSNPIMRRVIVRYTEGTKTVETHYFISIIALPTVAILKSITLSGKARTLFRVGQTFSYQGLVVTAHYSDSTSKQVTNFTVESSKVDMSEPGIYPVAVGYTENGIAVYARYEVEVVGKFGPRDNTHF